MSSAGLSRPSRRYTLVRRLAIGGMAEVYLGKATGPEGFEKPVAIKRLHPSSGAEATMPGRLSEEANLSVSLVHPNIVRTLDFGRADGAELLVMEHLEGCDAQQVLDALRSMGEPFPVDLAAYVVAEVCRGLHYAHEHRDESGRPLGLVHRDVSPQNVLLSRAGEVKIGDFGIARTCDRQSSPESNVIKGKYFYMSPEQARAEPLDRRSDVFSAGVVLWELLIGERLHRADDVATLLARVRSPKIPPPSTRREGSPEALDVIVARATRFAPGERYPDAASMARALERYLDSQSLSNPMAGLRSLAARLPVPTPAEPCAVIEVPETRHQVVTLPALDAVTPHEPPLRHSLSDGSPTLAGWKSPGVQRGSNSWMLAAAAGIGVVVWFAWWLFGA